VARQKASGAWREHLSEAYLHCAATLDAAGNSNEAVKVYRQLSALQEPEMIRIRALSGLAEIEGQNALPALTAAMAAQSPRVQAVCIRLLTAIPGPEVTASMRNVFPNLPPTGQVRLLTALATRGDASARPLLLEALKSKFADVRAAALSALGKMGDTASVRLLADAAARRQGAERNAARQSLARLPGSNIDAAIVAGIGSADAKVKSELILAAGERPAPGSGSALIQSLGDQDPDVRRSALSALKNVAGPAEIAPLLDFVQRSAGSDRKDATQALASALKKSPSAQLATAISAYRVASAIDLRLALLDAVGQTSSAEALPILREGLRDPNPEIARGAVLALTNWQDPAPLPDLLAVAEAALTPALQTLSLRGALKLIGVPSSRSTVESAKLLAGAMRLAKDPAEKRTVLSLLPAYPCDETLNLAEQSLDDPAVVNEAKASVQRIRNALKVK